MSTRGVTTPGAAHRVVPGAGPQSKPGTPKGGRNDRQGQDIGHLLNFQLPPRARQQATPRRSTRSKNGTASFNKERYVNAQMRFLLRPTGGNDYMAHFADPEVFFPWHDVWQVIVPVSSAMRSVTVSGAMDHGEAPTCPICLSPPKAARMTKCGHLYCFSCILHYLELAEDNNKWRRCPVCWDAVYAKDLKSVKWHDPVAAARDAPSSTGECSDAPHHTHREGTTLKMRLICRPQITTLALPRSDTWPSEALPPHQPPWQFTPDALAFAKFMLASPEYMSAELARDAADIAGELADLKRWDPTSIDIQFVEAAQRKVANQLEATEKFRTTAIMTARKAAIRELKAVEEKKGRARLPPLPLLESSEAESTGGEDSVALTELAASAATLPDRGDALGAKQPPKTKRNLNPPPPEEAPFFFYQAASGQHIYLHPLDFRILRSQFEAAESLPDTIEVGVEDTEEGSMDEHLARRCRYLSHLSPATDVVFIDADLSGVVSPEVLATYASALKQRRSKRKDKVKREDKAFARNEQREAEEQAKHLRDVAPTMMSSFHIPAYIPGQNEQEDEFSFPSVPLRATTGPSTSPSSVATSGAKSFASIMHGSSWASPTPLSRRPPGAGAAPVDSEEEEEVNATWEAFALSAASSPAGGATPGTPGDGAKKKKGKKQKVVLNLSASSRRG